MQTYQHPPFRSFITLVLCILAITACKETPPVEEQLVEPKRNKMFAEFFVRYLAPEQQLRGQASFWEGLNWSNLKPTEPQGIVSFEGQKMVPKRLPGGQIRFSETHSSIYEESLAFRFRNFDDKYLQYELKMTPIRDFFVKGEISKSTGATFVINGGIMSEEESLVFLFSNAEKKASAITIEGPSTDVEVKLSPQQLRKLSIGPGQLYLVKKQYKTEVHPKLELTAAIEYYTNSREVIVNE